MEASIWIPAAGTIVVALISAFSAWLAVRASKSQKQIEQRAAERAGLDKFYDQLNEDMRTEIADLRTQATAMRDRVKDLETEVEAMQKQRVRDRELIDELVDYARTLVGLLKHEGVTVPPAPASLIQYGYGPDLRRLP